MKRLHTHFLSDDELQYFYDNVRMRKQLANASHEHEKSVIDKLAAIIPVRPHEKAYMCVERNPNGHEWHTDTGTMGHMQWCQVGVIVMLSKITQYTGGWIHYDGFTVGLNQNELIYHTSDVRHKVEPHSGDRRVLLFFL